MALDSNSNQHYTEEHSPTNASELRSGKKMNHKTYRFNQQASNCATKPAHKCFLFQRIVDVYGNEQKYTVVMIHYISLR